MYYPIVLVAHVILQNNAGISRLCQHNLEYNRYVLESIEHNASIIGMNIFSRLILRNLYYKNNRELHCMSL